MMRNTRRSIRAFFSSRWHGHVPLERVFWRDMMVIGTAINVSMALAAFFLLAQGVQPALAIAIFLAPLPYNFLLYIAVWLAAAQARAAKAAAARLVATLWLLASVAI
jgi:hypothetical protein